MLSLQTDCLPFSLFFPFFFPPPFFPPFALLNDWIPTTHDFARYNNKTPTTAMKPTKKTKP
jgi:hypothetical protein